MANPSLTSEGRSALVEAVTEFQLFDRVSDEENETESDSSDEGYVHEKEDTGPRASDNMPLVPSKGNPYEPQSADGGKSPKNAEASEHALLLPEDSAEANFEVETCFVFRRCPWGPSVGSEERKYGKGKNYVRGTTQ
ncbi:hypothetical protein TGME49_311820 [Toxoplasma gondii ME49]|uniref:Uncharacterized protein n=4 Tax=Toxoplasma gondii TaxID=5811 RepID=B6K8P0_TOXGV|nr:hypothetical protein TGME49_311820 [Toxoplasma gondii ME49]EPT26058.1 hypothetical protein TGME49_311820 [Toxoplasma gondii ME49]ESS34985.1 hypothetical protein TGVEG_311820 [Toxoplasma gondii VEG]KYF47966.1 hypothetical protein TGARI_311820 [Toxoplasma gondii ARI]PIL98364.1 hypothetical protein TGCOUG_311820 [Toxoplasma gondii COUG]|eukprot:XP_002364414.1 hypothetical protein TGME49_311820 [Toxoplasma gondii ME49]